MKKHTTPFVEENKKRAAFKRFSQIGATGLAVMSLSAFTHLSAQQLPDFVERDLLKEQNALLENEQTYLFEKNEIGYGNYTDHTNYFNHSNYSNTPYSNNYSNYCNSAT